MNNKVNWFYSLFKRLFLKMKYGNKVWIGCNSIIPKGVTIGNNAIVGAGSVVTKNIKENEVFIQKR